jgi:hypothetical protein
MNLLLKRPNRIVVSGVLGNCAGAVACALVVAAFLVGWGEYPKIGAIGLLQSSFAFAGQAWLVGLAYLVLVVPTVLLLRRIFPPLVAAVVGATLGVAPGLVVFIGGNYYFGSAGLAHGAVAVLVATVLAYGRWGEPSNWATQRRQPAAAPGLQR